MGEHAARSWCLVPIRRPSILACLLTGAVALGVPPERYVASRQLLIEYRADGPAPPTAVDVWVSTDGGRSWSAAEAAAVGTTTLRYDAPADGRFDFYLVLHGAGGSSGEPPLPGASPAVSVIVDTLPPLLQIHQTELRDEGGRPIVFMNATFIEENRPRESVRVFYRTIPTDWIDGGPADVVDSGLIWYPPGLFDPPIELRLMAVDRAGNRCVANAALTPPPPRAAAPSAGPAPGGHAETLPLSGAESVLADDMLVAGPPPALTPRTEATLGHLRGLAERFAACGQYSLAAARFADALALAPQDADLLVDLGSTLYRLGRYDEAAQRFESALATWPDHVGALEGLALVAATQRRYAVAREHMQRLLRLRPHDGTTWLRAGDVEHRLGNTRSALESWRRALAARDADEDLRSKARRRLDYFGPPPADPELASTAAGPPLPPAGQTWQRPPPHPRSSLSSEMKTSRKPTP